MQLTLQSIELDSPSIDAVALLGEARKEQRGGVYTKREVVEFILDLVSYTEEKNLPICSLLEPSCGDGDFLICAIERLMKSAKKRGVPFLELETCIRAVDIGTKAIAEAKKSIGRVLKDYGLTKIEILHLLDAWFVQADFLMLPMSQKFSHIIGNPPYIRQEDLPKELLNLYRNTYSTMYDRADLYVPFIERSLSLLKKGGELGFICSDRWMKNRYGGPLRNFVSSEYHLKCYVDMTDCPTFDKKVVAYPAITIIAKQKGERTYASYRPEISSKALSSLVPALRDGLDNPQTISATRVVNGAEPWLLDNFPRLHVIRKIESQFPLLEEVACKVSIGVATGADRIYISKSFDLEPAAQLPLVTTQDILEGEIHWRGNYVLNPFEQDGTLHNLKAYPKMAAHLSLHEDSIKARNVAKKNRRNWYRTIDRIYPSLQNTPKLLIPDIKGNANVVYDKGEYYPHHNLYYILSDKWELRALQAVLLSQVAYAFVATYSLKMRGDCLRFQAQYLRRIRLPHWSTVPQSMRKRLKIAAKKRDIKACNCAVKELYQIDDNDWKALIGD